MQKQHLHILYYPYISKNIANTASDLYYCFDLNTKRFLILKGSTLYSLLQQQPDAIDKSYYYDIKNSGTMREEEWGNSLFPPVRLDYQYIKDCCFEPYVNALASVKQGINALRLLGVELDYRIGAYKGIEISKLYASNNIETLVIPYGITSFAQFNKHFDANVGTMILPNTFHSVEALLHLNNDVRFKNVVFTSPKVICDLSSSYYNSRIAKLNEVKIVQGVERFKSPENGCTPIAKFLANMDLSASKTLSFSAKAPTEDLDILARIKLPDYLCDAFFLSLDHFKYFCKRYWAYHKRHLTVLHLYVDMRSEDEQGVNLYKSIVGLDPSEGCRVIPYTELREKLTVI